MITKTRLPALAVTAVLTLIVLALLQDQAISVTANKVRHQTAVFHHGDLDPKSAERTLALLDHALNRLGAQWQPANGVRPIRVELHSSSSNMESDMGDSHQHNLRVAGYVECSSNGPVIHMPVHPNRPLLPDRPESQVANHEPFHAWLCQTLGAQAARQVPLWLNEGMATNLQANAVERLWVTQYLRHHVRTRGPQTADGLEFCHHLKNLGMTTYATAATFVRNMDASWPNASWHILSHIAAGQEFNTAFQLVTGTTCEKAYESWAATR